MGETFYQARDAKCADGATRRAMVKCYSHDGSFAADTWFSVPAYVKANGKTVRGYVSSNEDGLEFRAYLYRKNHSAIVAGTPARFDVEVTDTFGGEANYCWVHRHVIEVSAALEGKAERRAIVRAAKAAEGWTGYRCETNDMGGTIEIRPRGLLQVMFITFKDE